MSWILQEGINTDYIFNNQFENHTLEIKFENWIFLQFESINLHHLIKGSKPRSDYEEREE